MLDQAGVKLVSASRRRNAGEGAAGLSNQHASRVCSPKLSKDPDVRSQRSVSRGGLGESALVAGGTQSFHLIAKHNHSLGNAFVFLRRPCDCSVDRALVHKALKLLVSTQAQQFFAAIGCVSLSQIEQNNFE